DRRRSLWHRPYGCRQTRRARRAYPRPRLGRASGTAGRGHRRNGRGRRARRRLHRRWTEAGCRNGCPVRREAGSDAVIIISDEVREASAVVALETTLVAHGFPAGEGIAVGLDAERHVREAG